MRVIHARNVNHAYAEATRLLAAVGVREKSRAGDVFVFPEPVTTIYEYPRERVLWDPLRDANPFFHLLESLWMLMGRRDVAFLQRLVKRMAEFSDDGLTFHSAYGFRWRSAFLVDQLELLIEQLHREPTTRRAYLGIWNPTTDCGFASKDLPCNVGAHFMLRNGALDLTVFNRSNDLIWGAYGANAVQFSMLLEYVALAAGIRPGRYVQVSNNLHAYVSEWERLHLGQFPMAFLTVHRDPYLGPVNLTSWMMNGPEDRRSWDESGRTFFAWFDAGEPEPLVLRHPYWQTVVLPMWQAYRLWKAGEKEQAVERLENVSAEDWGLAGLRWMRRRLMRRGDES